MERRLVMQVYKTADAAEPFAAVQVYCSAYSFSALRETAFLLEHLTGKTCQTTEEWQKEIVDAYLQHGYEPCYFLDQPDWERRHGGIYREDIALAQHMWPDMELDVENADGNLGLVAISQSGIAELQKWSEGKVVVYLDTMTVDWYVFFQSPVSAWIHRKDGNWQLSGHSDFCISDQVWENLSEIQTTGLTLSDVTEFLENDARKVSKDGFALADSRHTVIEIIQ